jgi:hypothetical protein
VTTGIILNERMSKMTSVQELYETSVRVRPTSERLQLAALILNDISPDSIVDYSETWSEEDILEFREASSNYMIGQLEKAENA